MYTGTSENGILIALQRSSSKHLPRMSRARSLELSYFVHAAARLRPKMLLRVAATYSSLTACVLLSSLLLTLQMFPNACTFNINAKNSYYETICNLLPSSRPSPHMSDEAWHEHSALTEWGNVLNWKQRWYIKCFASCFLHAIGPFVNNSILFLIHFAHSVPTFWGVLFWEHIKLNEYRHFQI